MADSHSVGPGSIPGRRIIFNNLLEAKLSMEKKNNCVFFEEMIDQLVAIRCFWTMDLSLRSSSVCALSDLTKFNFDFYIFSVVRNNLFMIIFSIVSSNLNDEFVFV